MVGEVPCRSTAAVWQFPREVPTFTALRVTIETGAFSYGANDPRHNPVVSGKTQGQVMARSMIQSAVT